MFFFLLTLPWTVLAGKDYRFAFFTGVSSVFCWPFLRTTVGLSSLLRLVDCTFNLKSIINNYFNNGRTCKTKRVIRHNPVWRMELHCPSLMNYQDILFKSSLLKHYIPAQTIGRPCTLPSHLSRVLHTNSVFAECSRCRIYLGLELYSFLLFLLERLVDYNRI